ncbi:MAG: hypothetical protein V4548_09905, partial [Bacteroidota bacterium]
FGMLVPNRHASSTAYRYGFQGQEKVDEISGEGNHNTAMFWEYDTRIGRRWNLDPIDKPFLSDYSVLGNNPISRVDENGDDDIFYMKGGKLYMKRTKEGTQIKIQVGKKIYSLSQLPMSNIENRRIAAKIIGHYASKDKELIGSLVGVAKHKPKNKDDKAPVMHTNGLGGSIIADYDIGNLNKDLDDYNNLINTIAHEKGHKFAKKELTIFTDHVDVYAQQFEDDSFGKTTDEYKTKRLVGAAIYLMGARAGNADYSAESEGTLTKYENRINKAIGKYGYSIELNKSTMLNIKGYYYDIYKDGIKVATQGYDETQKTPN